MVNQERALFYNGLWKNNLCNYLFSILMAFSLSGCAFLPPKLNLPASVTSMDELEPFLTDAVSKRTPPSISVAVIKNDNAIYTKAFGYTDLAGKQEASPDTVYQWWSLTKLFTAVALLQLQEQNLLSIDDPVAKHLPTFTARGRHSKEQVITIKQLLSHSSGLGDIGMEILGWVHFDGDPHPTQTEFFNSHVDKYNKLKVKPGEQGRYSNFGYMALGALIEAVSGQSYESYIVENITAPLGMNNTHFIYTAEMELNAAKGSHPKDVVSVVVPFYLDTDRAIEEKRNGILWFNRVYSNQKGATGLIGPSVDLLKFMAVFLPGYDFSDNPILGKDSIELMVTPVVNVVKSPAPADNLQFGLGWFIGDVNGEQTLSHGGSGMAFVSMIIIYPERELGTIVMANSTYLGRTMGFKLSQLLGQIDW